MTSPPSPSPSPAPVPDITVARATAEHDAALAVFFRRAWGQDGDADAVRRAREATAGANPVEPGADAPVTLYLRDGEVLGHLGSFPAKWWNGSVESPAHWLNGFMVLPEHRNGPVGFAVLKEMLRQVDVAGVMTVAAPARRLFTAVGFTDCGPIPNFIAPLRLGRMASRIDVNALGLGVPRVIGQLARLAQRTGLALPAGAFAGLGLSALRAMSGGTALRIEAGGALPPAPELDALWQNARAELRAAAVRDASMLAWRYVPASGSTYECVTARDSRGELRGLAIVRRPSDATDERLRGIRVATLSDLLCSPRNSDAVSAVIAGAERLALRLGADALLCSASHPAITAALSRRRWVRLPGNVHLMHRDPGKRLGLPSDAAEWWVTRGDAHADETF